MTRLSRDQRKLADALLALGEDAMLLEEFDGFVAGLLVCPEMIAPSAWLKSVWNREGGEADPTFESLEHANAVLELIMTHYNAVARTLFVEPERYAPILAIDRRNGDVLWELWIEGFEAAVKLNSAAWARLITGDDVEAAKAFAGLMTLADIARRDPRFSKAEIDAVSASAHERLAEWVRELNGWRLANMAAATPGTLPIQMAGAPGPKVGRNHLCPCGSGKKYKKCCGLN